MKAKSTRRAARPLVRRVAIGADHGGFELKAALVRVLQAKGL